MPAAMMKILLQGNTVERTWTGRRNSSGSICLVNVHTGEGAWNGSVHPVCLRCHFLSFIVTSSRIVARHTYQACSSA